MAGLDFDGDYGRQYAATIRQSVPGYDTLLQLGACALAAACPQAATALVVGPGPGEELEGLLQALPQAHLTVVEPSAQMLASCRQRVEALGASERTCWFAEPLEQGSALAGQRFDAVICHHVLHLLPPEEQDELLRQLAAAVAPGGHLLLSSYSEAAEPEALERVLAVARCRWLQQGVPADRVELILASRNSRVFSLDADRLAAELAAAGLEPPLQLFQALFSRMWISRRPA
ncbi:MAG: class I SAM-dependent methyltransferase [Cyanobium sp.]